MYLFRNKLRRPSYQLIKRRKIFGFLVASIMLLTVGFASLSATLTISGTGRVEGRYSVRFENYDANGVLATNTGNATSVAPVIDQGQTRLNNFGVVFSVPGDKVEFKFKIINDGNISAEIGGLTIAEGTFTGEDQTYVSQVENYVTRTLKYVGGAKDGQNLQIGDVIGAQEEQTVALTYTLTDFESETLASPVSISNLQVAITYIKSYKTTTTLAITPIEEVENNGSSSLVATDESCFTFSSGKITGYDDYNCETDVVIPSEIDGETVTSIGANAFVNQSLTKVFIPYTVTSIDSSNEDENLAGAFYNNSQLSSVAFEDTQEHPSELITIGDDAFSGCAIETLIIPANVTEIGKYAFTQNQLTSILIPRSVTTIGQSSFSQNKLSNVTIPYSVTLIETGAFHDNLISNLVFEDTQEYPSELVTIKAQAFAQNQLTSITIPKSVTTIGTMAFYDNDFPNASAIIINYDANNLESRFDSKWTSIGVPAKE